LTRDTVHETIEGIKAGANDYIKKPVLKNWSNELKFILEIRMNWLLTLVRYKLILQNTVFRLMKL
jgi:DNA-binding response OmpR family regulator